MNISAYLTFNGNCRQAMTFYQKCLGGKLTFQTVSKTPGAHALPPKARRSILQATLRKDDLVLVGTDMVGDLGLLKGNAVSMLLHCKTKHNARRIYDRLSKDGRKTQPLTVNFFDVLMGSITDKYGYHWILTVTNSPENKR
ncbi:MAG: VOC family protein [Bacteroidetes bacterium CHB5]|nr:VOC family protein [Bacteroidetes bacterium CHB5]